MATIQNLFGTSNSSFQIGMTGPTIYTGTPDPTSTPPTPAEGRDLAEGDLYIRTLTGSEAFWMYQSGDWYEIPSGKNGGTFYGALTVEGNLVVNGTTTTIDTASLAITDPIITLNDGDPGPGVTSGYSGISVNRGGVTAATFLWDEGNQRWYPGGVGTSLYAATNVTAGTQVLSAVGSVGTPGFGFVSETNTGLYRISAGILGVTVSGSQKLVVQTSSAASDLAIIGTSAITIPSGSTGQRPSIPTVGMVRASTSTTPHSLEYYSASGATWYTALDTTTAASTYVPQARTISVGSGLSGGGDLSANRTISFNTIGNNTVLANVSGITAIPIATTITNVIDGIGSTRGSVLYRGAAGWAILAPGTVGHSLLSGGSGADPSYGQVSLTAGVTDTLPVLNGGTGTTTSTGTAGNVVLSISPTITGHPTIEGVTATGATGTGKFVFDASPTISGTLTTSSITANGLITGQTGVAMRLGTGASNAGAGLVFAGSSTNKNWFIGNQYNVGNTLEFTLTSAIGGTTPDTTISYGMTATAFYPGTDNAVALGGVSNRWSTIYGTTISATSMTVSSLTVSSALVAPITIGSVSGTNNPSGLLVVGPRGNPATSGSTADGIARFSYSTSTQALDIGVTSTPSTLSSWIQSRNPGSYATNYDLWLNPNGGNVSIGHTTTQSTLFAVNGTMSVATSISNPLYTAPAGNLTIQSASNSNVIINAAGSASVSLRTNSTQQLLIGPTGAVDIVTNLAIGGATIGGHALAVTGTTSLSSTLSVPYISTGTSSYPKTILSMTSGGSQYGTVQVENTGGAGAWSLGYQATANSTIGTAALTWNGSGQVSVPTSLAIGGATIASNALAVTGATNISGDTTFGSKIIMSSNVIRGASAEQLNLLTDGKVSFTNNADTSGVLIDLATNGTYKFYASDGTTPGTVNSGEHTPLTGGTYNLGSSSVRWNNIYAQSVSLSGYTPAQVGDFTGVRLVLDNDAILRRSAAGNFAFGAVDAASPVAQTLSVQNVVAGTSNTAGADLTVAASRGTGTGVGGAINFQYAVPGSTGSTQNSLGTYWQMNQYGFAIGQPSGGYNLMFNAGTVTSSVSSISINSNNTHWQNRGDGANAIVIYYSGAGDISLGPSAAVATSATNGFVMLGSTAGTPSGVPSNAGAGKIPFVYNTSNNVPYFYNSGWKGVGMLANSNSWTGAQTITGSGLTPLTLESTDAGAALGPILDIYRNSASPAVSDLMGAITFSGNSSTSVKRTYGAIYVDARGVTNAGEYGRMTFQNMRNGTLTTQMYIDTDDKNRLVFAGQTNGIGGNGNQLTLGYDSSGVQLQFLSSGIIVSSAMPLQWGSSAFTTPDVGLSRFSAGVLGVGTGAAGSVAGTLQAATVIVPIINAGTSSALTLQSNNATAATIDTSGRFLVGVTAYSQSSTQKAEVYGGMTLLDYNDNSVATVYIRNRSTTAATIQPYLYLNDNGGNRGGLGVQYDDSSVHMHGHGSINFRVGASGLSAARQVQINGSNSAVNYFTLAGALTTASPTMAIAGSDTNISMKLTPKGTGAVEIANSGAAAGTALKVTGSIQMVNLTNGSDVFQMRNAANGVVAQMYVDASHWYLTTAASGNMRFDPGASGKFIVHSSTAIPAGGTAGIGYTFSSTSNFGTFFGSGAPSLSAAQGSLYLRSDGLPHYNTNGTTGWTSLAPLASPSFTGTVTVENNQALTFTGPSSGSSTITLNSGGNWVFNQNADGSGGPTVFQSAGVEMIRLNGTIGMILFGGTTSSFPALKRSSADLHARLADDSGYAAMTVASITSSSDPRLKRDITPISNVDGLLALNAYSYAWKRNGVKSIGLLTTEVKEQFPELVSTDDEGYENLNYNGVVALLVAANNTLTREVAELKREMAEIKEKL